MKHTDFWQKILEIKAQEQRELIEAIKAHGGSYSWNIDNGDECPIIAINPVEWNEPMPVDVEISRVWLEEGQLKIQGTNKYNYCEEEVMVSDIFAGHISFITDYIPETENVSDVTQKQEFFKITSVSRDDLNGIGFDTSKVDDGVMESLASKLANDYCEQLFWLSLEIIAEDYFKIPRIWDSWFNEIDFATIEKISGLKQTDFSPEDGYQDFIDAFEDWRDGLDGSEKQEIYNQYNQNETSHY